MRLRSLKAACCIVLGLCMHVVSWAPLCLVAGGAVIESGSEFIEHLDTTADLLSENVGTFTLSDEQLSIRVVEKTDLRVLLSNSDVIDEIDAQLEDGVTQGNTEDARKKNPRFLALEQKLSHLSRSLTSLFVLIVAALCLWFLTFRQKGPPTSQAFEESLIQQEDGIDDKLRSRLKALQALIPLADQLGTAVDTTEARELLQAVHANVPKEGEGDDKGSTVHEENIENALSAIRGLQQAAVKEAGSILQMNFDNLSSVSSLLEEWEKGYFSEKEVEGLSPFITALKLWQNHFLEVSQHMQEVYKVLEQTQSFEDEQDVTSLLSTTDGFKFISKLQEERESAVDLALRQRKMAESAMRMALSRKTSQGFRQQWGELEIAHAYVNIAKQPEAVAALDWGSAAELQEHLDEAELRLTKCEEELKRLMTDSLSRQHDSISGTLTRNATLKKEQENLRASLANYWDNFGKHVEMPTKLEDSGRESVKSVLTQALQRISKDRDTMDTIITSTLSRMAKVFDDPEMNKETVLFQKGMHGILHRRMAAEMLNLLERGESRTVQLKSFLQSVEQQENTKAAARMMKNAVFLAVQSSDELTELLLSVLRTNLLISVERNASSTMEEAADVLEELKDFSSNPKELKTLLDAAAEQESLLTEAYREAKNAGALEDRIKAAGRIQELSSSLRHRAYTLKYNTLPKR
ncbi:hypothetical protein Emed_006551 [Eimeria media]